MGLIEIIEYGVRCDNCGKIVDKTFLGKEEILTSERIITIEGYKWDMRCGTKGASCGTEYFCSNKCKDAFLKKHNAEEL